MVQDIVDDSRGDIRNANVKFRILDEDGDHLNSTEWIDVADLLYPYTGSVMGDPYKVELGKNEGFANYQVEVLVNNYYISNEDPYLVTIYEPVGDFITGGGYIITENSSGLYPAAPGSRTNFGFNVKFNKTGKNLQGHLNFIWRTADGRIMQAKANAMNSLGVNIDGDCKEAVFVAKCNVVDHSGQALHNSGGLLMYVTLTDCGEPGESHDLDYIGFTLWNGNELWYSSDWDGMQTQEMDLTAGNLVVHSGFSLGVTDESANVKTKEAQIATSLEPEVHLPVFNVYPNPFSDRLRMEFVSEETTHGRVDMFDMTGRLVQTIFNQPVEAGELYQAEFVPGSEVSSFYIYRLTLGDAVRNGKVIYRK
ncbi:MAG: T9SS type A sorting domain-containing protein [Mariniphaga sp.]|nr:T9SS type A sorting domain-containing protein [Mariniphaga sp.]